MYVIRIDFPLILVIWDHFCGGALSQSSRREASTGTFLNRLDIKSNATDKIITMPPFILCRSDTIDPFGAQVGKCTLVCLFVLFNRKTIKRFTCEARLVSRTESHILDYVFHHFNELCLPGITPGRPA